MTIYTFCLGAVVEPAFDQQQRMELRVLGNAYPVINSPSAAVCTGLLSSDLLTRRIPKSGTPGPIAHAIAQKSLWTPLLLPNMLCNHAQYEAIQTTFPSRPGQCALHGRRGIDS
jgi:hypothetical protein